jgi:hypothetical protein
MLNALDTLVEAAHHELEAAQDAAAAVPARIRLGEIAPDMVRLDAEVKQITHAIRMAAYNAETTLARALDGHYARAGHEAYALIREALTTSGDIIPGHGELLIRLDPLTARRQFRAQARGWPRALSLAPRHSRRPGSIQVDRGGESAGRTLFREGREAASSFSGRIPASMTGGRSYGSPGAFRRALTDKLLCGR